MNLSGKLSARRLQPHLTLICPCRLAPEPTPAAKQTARASRYLLAGLLASLYIVSGPSVPESGRRAGLAVVTLILAGASCALVVTSLLARYLTFLRPNTSGVVGSTAPLLVAGRRTRGGPCGRASTRW